MAISKQKRAKMEEVIYTTFDKLDPSGANTTKYKNMFSKMTDNQFDTFFKNFFKNEDTYLILDIIDYEREVKLEDIEKAAKYLKVPLFEKVIIPFANGDKEHPTITKHEVPVGYLHCKRMQQILTKKNSTSIDITKRSQFTGQVINQDKNARQSDQENSALVVLDAENSLREFLGGRSDDMVMKHQMYDEISRKGYVSLNELTNDVKNKTALNTLDVYLKGMGFNTDLTTKGLEVQKTLEV